MVLMQHKPTTKLGNPEFEDTPCSVTAVYDNGTVQIKKKKYYETVNIHQSKPYISPVP
jgi:hypothetical protein